MKPYGRNKYITGGQEWKKDYHLHDKRHRKVESWWEGIADFISRSAMKQTLKKEIDKEE